MNKFFKNFNQYGQGVLWLEEAKVREAKKQALQTAVRPQEAVVEISSEVAGQRPQTVFARSDSGHTQEEARLIQDLYNKLANLPIFPPFAAV